MTTTRSALVVATDRYDDPKLARLQAPRRDAEALADVLSDPAIGGFDVEHALNRPEGEVRRRLSRFFADRGRDDLLLVHFSCHGLKNESGGLYFAAPDTEVAHLDVTAIPADLVDRLMTQSRSRRIVLLLDCCFGGAFSRGLGRRAGESVDVQEPLDGSGPRRADGLERDGVRVRGRRRCTARRSPSVFTAALVRGLRTGEADLRRRPAGIRRRALRLRLRGGAARHAAHDAEPVRSGRGPDDHRPQSARRSPRRCRKSARPRSRDAPRPRMTTPRTAAPPTAPIVVVALAGILVAVSSLLGFYGDDSLFGAFSVITGATVVFALAGTLGCGLAATALAVLSRDPRAAVAVPLLGAAALGATIGGLDFNYVDYFDVTSLNDLEGHDMPTGLELAIVAAPVLWGAGLLAPARSHD